RIALGEDARQARALHHQGGADAVLSHERDRLADRGGRVHVVQARRHDLPHGGHHTYYAPAGGFGKAASRPVATITASAITASVRATGSPRRHVTAARASIASTPTDFATRTAPYTVCQRTLNPVSAVNAKATIATRPNLVSRSCPPGLRHPSGGRSTASPSTPPPQIPALSTCSSSTRIAGTTGCAPR